MNTPITSPHSMMPDPRMDLLTDFLRQHVDGKWAAARMALMGQDASTRRYFRLHLGETSALLMDAPPALETATCPVDADDAARIKLGYNAMARLAGADLNAFTGIAKSLRDAGIYAPEILADDPVKGIALIEDMGDNIFAQYLIDHHDRDTEQKLYTAAIHDLIRVQAAFDAPAKIQDHHVMDYDHLAMLAEVELLPQWYAPHLFGEALSDNAHQAWQNAWGDVLQTLSAPHCLVLRDFHAENLLWVETPNQVPPHAEPKVGMIDFQDGLFGHRAYDLASLIEDARRDLSDGMGDILKQTYMDTAAKTFTDFDQVQFEMDYAILAAQRNAKILGIFARLIHRDGKEKYRRFFARVEAFFRQDIAHPIMEPIRAWCADYMPHLLPQNPIITNGNINTAMILAAGKGTRMQPLTNDTPKSLIELNDIPFMQYNMDMLADAGVQHAVVNMHYLADQIDGFLDGYNAMHITRSDEREMLLETGGGLVKALPALQKTAHQDPIFCINTDAVFPSAFLNAQHINPAIKLRHFWDDAKMDALLCLVPVANTLGYHGAGDFQLVDENASTTQITRKNDQNNAPAFVYTGLQLIHPRLFADEQLRAVSTNVFWDKAFAHGRIYGMVMDIDWLHMGDPKALDDAHTYLRDKT